MGEGMPLPSLTCRVPGFAGSNIGAARELEARAAHCLKLGGKKRRSARPFADRKCQGSIHLRFRSPQGLGDLR
jgi:hypothetical protein